MSEVIELNTDVLVIGGGAAGARAALDTSQAGLKTVLVVKGLLGKSGCSIFAGNLNFFAAPERPLASPAQTDEALMERIERTMSFLAKYTHYLGDQEYMKNASAFHQTEFFPWLERQGLYLLRDAEGRIVTDQPKRSQAWAVQMGMSGTVMMDLLRKAILASPIQLHEQTMATRLLTTHSGAVAGAVALDYVQGQLYVIRAKVVILATGHSNHLSLRSTGTREGTAGGWVMAYEAGARLQNIEMQWYHASDVAYPAAWMRLHLYPNPLPGTRARSRLYNEAGELFFDGNWFPDNPVPYILQLKHLVKQIRAGKARLDGGYYSSFEHVEPEVLEEYIYQTQFMHKIGVDLKTAKMENGVTWHMNVGGVRVDGQTMQSDVDGLLVAGSVGALVTGGLPNVVYDGLMAARTAASLIQQQTALHAPEAAQVAAEVERVCALARVQPRDGLLPGQVKKRIRTVVWKQLNYIKSAASLGAALEALDRIEHDDLPRMRLQTDTRRFNYDWVEALDAIDMLAALKLQARFSLFRQESRGAFYREDFPLTDNEHWLMHAVGWRGADGSLVMERYPVALPYARPDAAVVDFFEADY